MFQQPKAAKRLYFDVIPKTVDDYLTFLDKYPGQDDKTKLANPVWHIHSGAPPKMDVPISFSMLLNLASVSHAEDKAVLWGFIQRYAPGSAPESHPKLDELVGYAVRYYHDFVKPSKRFAVADEVERAALEALRAALAALPADTPAEDIQVKVYDIGRAIPRYHDLKAKGATPGAPRRVAGVVRRHLPPAARPGEGAALRLVRGDLRPARDRGADRQGAGGGAGLSGG